MDTTHSKARPPSSPRGRRAFTLTELLIVIGLIVLIIALAVPAFKAMTGGRSIDAAQNQLAAVLGAARAEAVGLQKVRGVFFYLDPATDRVTAALVRETSVPSTPVNNPPDFYLDLVPDRDPLALPVGIGLQGIDDADLSGSGGANPRRDDGYIGFNAAGVPVPNGADASTTLRYGPVILFDGYGRLLTKSYGFLLGERPDPMLKKLVPTRMGERFGYAPGAGSDPPAYLIPTRASGSGTAPAPQSLLGFVLFDGELFRAQSFVADDKFRGDLDPQITGGAYSQGERDEEAWLDKNATPVLVNRFNGTLIRGE